ncbi:MAG: thiamine diphosphokinase [Lactobacillus sp.]|jgi:thiamine pyrophosphokinase|nr:thiamine diphosphokinase [Lactobacillus sp.]
MRSFTEGVAVLGGPADLRPLDFGRRIRQAKDQGKMLIGVDGGSLACLQAGTVPDLAIGDFDSLTEAELGQVEQAVSELRYAQPAKDLTDSELMLEAAMIDYQLDRLLIIGATGGRLDHFLVNLFMVNKPAFRQFAEKITLLDRQNLVEFFLPGQHKLQSKPGYKYLAFAPLQSVQNLVIKGAKYELPSFAANYPLCFSSNEFVPGQAVQLSFSRGLVAAIYSHD